MELQERSETRETDDVAVFEEPESDCADVQRCVSETRSFPETEAEPTRLRAFEARVGNVLSTPFVSLMSQVALEFEVLV